MVQFSSTAAAGLAAHAAVPAFASETFVSPFLLLAIAGALYLVMARIALPRAGRIIETRAQLISGGLAETERMKAESEFPAAAYEASLKDAHAQARAMARTRAMPSRQTRSKSKWRSTVNSRANRPLAGDHHVKDASDHVAYP